MVYNAIFDSHKKSSCIEREHLSVARIRSGGENGVSWGDGAVLYSDYDGATRIYTPVKICGTAYHKEVNCTVFFFFLI